MGRFADAAESFSAALELAPDQRKLLEELRIAEDELHTVLLTYPQHAQTLDRCGLVALQLGRTEEAIGHLRRAVVAALQLEPTRGALGVAQHVTAVAAPRDRRR